MTPAAAPIRTSASGTGFTIAFGANLARLEMRVICQEFFGRMSHVELAGEPEWTRSNKHTGLRHLPVRVRPKRAT